MKLQKCLHFNTSYTHTGPNHVFLIANIFWATWYITYIHMKRDWFSIEMHQTNKDLQKMQVTRNFWKKSGEQLRAAVNLVNGVWKKLFLMKWILDTPVNWSRKINLNYFIFYIFSHSILPRKKTIFVVFGYIILKLFCVW